ncbi:MAG: response regulator [Desulfarculaceae bacterium]|nr:response regulator [Desulfarculaceae bacterium]MCF8071502.1 response regulator [Desulfarculaceae bacterium]MCF8102317.1 response regulator [Desulfarculaceae bacterium]MCF8114781.1 response regulator [Desulfarculaceae bacterium]
MELAQSDLQEKAAELSLASKYKSEFLANMSHELRTPLNSLLLLAQALAENKEGNLSQEQVEFSQIIHASGSDLLNLINEILDLAKIEAGRIDLRPAKVATEELAQGISGFFEHMANQKGLELKVSVDPEAPTELFSDRQRIEQILKNLVANAIKFTDEGGVEVIFHPPREDMNKTKLGMGDGDFLAVSVSDTGIGIDPHEQRVIFEAFQQVDGSTSRRYGGTGLGLSISRELAHLLGGAIEVKSRPGQGSTFTVYLALSATLQGMDPVKPPAQARPSFVQESSTPVWRDSKAAGAQAAEPKAEIEDDRQDISSGERMILIVEDDPNFARILYSKCHAKGFKCLAAASGEAGLELAREYLPDAVILDLHLPGLDGWSVLEAMKEDTRTRHIPVHIMSVEQASSESLRKGAVGHATKPVDSQELEAAFDKLAQVAAQGTRRVLVVEDNEQLRRNTVSVIGGGDVEVDEADTAARAMEALREQNYDCIVLDLGLPDMDGRQLLEALQQEGMDIPPVIVYTARDMTREEETALRENTESIIIKGVRSQERLLDEVSLFLHRMVSKMPARKRQIIRNLHDSEAMLAGKKVMVVDDDMRTTFAVAALLSELGMEVIKANNGQKALQLLEDDPGVDLVLMDIMMPVMDGYQAMEKIRAQERLVDLPIIALTAKAMPVDREKCLQAGANDYLPKPVDRDKLISMIRVWLYR